MKILHVNNYGTGFGTEKYIKEIIDSLQERGHESALFVQKVCGGNRPVKALVSANENLQRLKSMVNSFKPDVIHIHNITNYRLLDYLLTAGPVLKSIHEFRPFCIPRRIPPQSDEHCNIYLSPTCFKTGCFSLSPMSIYRYIVEKKGGHRIRKFPRFWVYSNFMKQFVDPLLPSSAQVDVVNYYYDPPADDPPPLPQEDRVFSAGRLVVDKGYHLLFDALSRLETQPEVRLAGEGDQEQNLRNQASRLHLDIDFLGYHPPTELLKHYHWCKVAVFPSDYPEPFGIVGLESMGAARPVVAFDVGGVTDWLKDGKNGFVVARGDVQAYSDRIKTLLNDTDLACRMGQTGRQMLLERFSSKQHVDQLVETYSELINH